MKKSRKGDVRSCPRQQQPSGSSLDWETLPGQNKPICFKSLARRGGVLARVFDNCRLPIQRGKQGAGCCRGWARHSGPFLLSCCQVHTAVLADYIQPQLQGQVLSLGHTELPAQFRRVTLLKDVEVERNRSRQKAHVVAILLAVSFEFGQGQVVGIESHQMEVAVGAGEHLDKAILVALREGGNGHTIKLDAVLLMKRPATTAKFHHGLGGSTRRKLDYIDIRRGPLQSLKQRDDETADAVEAHGRIDRLVTFFEE